MERRANSVGGSFEDWYTRVKQHAPTPKIHRHAKLVPYEEKQKKKKTQIRPLLVEQETPQVQVCEPVEILPLEPAPIMPPTALVPANAGPILNDAVNMGDWMVGPSARGYTAQWNDFQTGGHVGEARYTFCEDQVQVSVHLGEEQNSLAGMSMTRRTSRLVIDFGAPSCWHAGEEPKRTSFSDSPCWSDSDMTDEIALLMDPGVFSWDDASSMNHVTYTTPLNLL
ncbi:unnamed protein product [Phytophthora lilii]|uniref:Unnamed protein product n=1 Tax=Phytophthora lilii TaxID=2077276 RepID=A0A9W6X0M5_9STRA|nr:unnamed protein product [Phytophthora lilii]